MITVGRVFCAMFVIWIVDNEYEGLAMTIDRTLK